jgi:SNF2 family DNA or RNA helicase
MLLRLRQACNHPSLVGGANRGDGAVTTSRFDRIGADGRGLNANAESRRDAAMSVGALPNEGGVFVKTPASAVAAARRLPAALRGMMRAAAEHGRCVCSICGDPPSDPTVASCCARPFCGDCVSPRVDALPAPTPSAGKKERNAAGAVAAADGLTADGFACPSCGTTLTRALLHSAAALVAADAPRANAGSSGVPAAQEKGLSAAEQRAPRNAPGGRLARGGAGAASGPSVEALMAGTKVRGIMDYLTALREKHKAVVAAAKAKATSRGKAQTQKFSPGGAAAAAAVAKGTQLRRGIRSSDAALAAALPPLAPVCAPGGAHQRGGSLSHAHALGGSGGSGSQKHAVPAAEKAIVFSQWTAMLDLLEPCLRAAEIKFRRLDGTMSLAARERALSEFEAKPEVTVILMSLKAAGLGVNLTCANHVLLSDVWWNPTAEEQAIDRAHRIGQNREVRVARFTVRDTVEDRILALQDRKRAMVAAAFGDEADDGFGGSSRRAQLTTEDLVFLFGSEKEA